MDENIMKTIENVNSITYDIMALERARTSTPIELFPDDKFNEYITDKVALMLIQLETI